MEPSAPISGTWWNEPLAFRSPRERLANLGSVPAPADEPRLGLGGVLHGDEAPTPYAGPVTLWKST